MVQRETGRMTEASANFDRALEVSREIVDRRVEAIVPQNVGAFLGEHGRIQEKRGHCEAALAIFREVGDGCLDTALAINREVGDTRLEGIVLATWADLVFALGQRDEARDALIRGEALQRAAGDTLEIAKLLCVRGRTEAADGLLDAARATLAEAEASAASIGTGPGSALRR